MWDTAGEVGTSSYVMSSCGTLHMDEQRQGDQLEPTYIQQLSVDTGYRPEDLPEAMEDREGWWKRVRDVRADGSAWRWWNS